ncbi:hypothetical protein [uncultured Nostoc sp.]|uniref:hypothetical protein n=1 Tax=uncultured Nostoc sp. TaxID=340711 RepID=UPI0035CBE9CD
MNTNLKPGTLQYKIIEFLAQHPDQGWNYKEIALGLNHPNKSVSCSLSVLEKKRLVRKIVDFNSRAAKYIYNIELPISEPTVPTFVEQEPSVQYNIMQRLHKVRMETEQLRREEEKLVTTLEVLNEFIA